MSSVLILSGGLDSVTTLYYMVHKNKRPINVITFNYGQRHVSELEFASYHAKICKVERHEIFKIDINRFGKSALTDFSINVPLNNNKDTNKDEEIPVTYVPARNTIFLSYALAFAEVTNSFEIFIGANAIDYSGYPDCRPEYLSKFEELANLASKFTTVTKNKIKISAPLLKLKKSEIIKLGLDYGVDYGKTLSCYNPIVTKTEILSCGKCDSCTIRLQGFLDNNTNDPAKYFA